MMKNLLIYLRHKYSDDILLYFTKEAKEEVKDNKQDDTNKRIIYTTDKFIEEEEIDEIGLSRAQSFVNE